MNKLVDDLRLIIKEGLEILVKEIVDEQKQPRNRDPLREDRLLTIKEASAFLKISKVKFYKDYLNNDRIKRIRMGKKTVRISQQALFECIGLNN